MTFAILSLALALTGSPMSATEPAPNASPTPAPSSTTSTYLVVYKPGPAFLPGKPLTEQPLREHGRYMLSLFEAGTLKFAGGFADDSGGALAFEAADEASARAIVQADPAVVSGVFVFELHPWRLVDWPARLARSREAKKP